ESAIDHFTVDTHTPRAQQIPRACRILHQTRLTKDGRNRHIFSRNQLDLRQIFRQLAIFHSVTSGTVRIGGRLPAMETRDKLFSQLDLDVTRVRPLLDITPELLDLFHRAEAEQLEVAPHQRVRHGYQLV